ncbi:MAG: hypothetical protein GY856_21405 [bacterium]|nr:hypothetical protein [bacterium]
MTPALRVLYAAREAALAIDAVQYELVPRRLSYSFTEGNGEKGTVVAMLTNPLLNPELDPELFALKVPEGYQETGEPAT